MFSAISSRRRPTPALLFSALPTTALLLSVFLVTQSAILPADAHAQPAVAEHDVIVFANGDQLTGKLKKVVDGKVYFHSDILGDIRVKMTNVKSVRSADSFAVISRGAPLARRMPHTAVTEGTISIGDNRVVVGAADKARSVPLDQMEFIVPRQQLEKALYGKLGWRNGWSGALAGGAALVEATQKSRTFTGSISVNRVVPSVDWLPPSLRSSIDASAAYGSVISPDKSSTKTNIVHADLEQDWFLTRRFFLLGIGSWGHNFSQGLDLQQVYGLGAGYTVMKRPSQELDFKADLHFERQSFSAAPGVEPPVVNPARNLIGMNLGDNYRLKFFQGIVFEQTLTASPTFNRVDAYSALGSASLIFPVYKRLSFNLGSRADFLNDPGFGSKKNSVQFTAGVGYSFNQ